MSSSPQAKKDAHLRIVSSEDPVAFPAGAESTDDTPTVISKHPPGTQLSPSGSSLPFADLVRQSISPESLVAIVRRLAHFDLIEPIGSGGMATVIRARDTQLDRFVALKILPAEMAREIENVRRFHQEAKAAAKLDHENIARVFFCGEDKGFHFIAFEFVEGVTLRAMLEQRQKLPVGESIRYILQVAAGLEHASSRGVVHRDVKPSNIIITPTGRAKLVDMGLARNMERKSEGDLTQSGVTLGTFDYISPEQALEPRDADSRSDIYSLGCTLYHMLTGKPPVPEGTPAKKLHHHQHILPDDPRQLNPEIPEEIVIVLGKMLAKNPRDRYARPILLVQHLMQVAQKIGAADDVPEGVLFIDAPVPSPPRSRPLLMIPLALAALVAVIFLLSLSPEPRYPVANRGTLPSGAEIAEPGNGTEKSQPHSPVPASAATTAVVQKAEDLQTALADPAIKEIKIDKKTDLKSTPLTFHGGKDQQLVIESKDAEPDGHAIISFLYNGGATAGIVLEGDGAEVVFRCIKFKLQVDSDIKLSQAVAMVLAHGIKKVTFDHCIFMQADVPPLSEKRIPLASLLIDDAKDGGQPAPKVFLRECHFDSNSKTGGQAAIALNGPVELDAANCTFRPHGAFFHVRQQSKAAQATVVLKHCEGFVVQGPAFRFDERASARVRVESSVFSNPNKSLLPLPPSAGLPLATLIYVADDAALQYVGKQNLYHNLNSLVERKNKMDFLTKADDFQVYLRGLLRSSDPDSQLLDQSANPWQDPQPLDTEGDLAFQLRGEYFGKYGLYSSWLRDGRLPSPPASALVKAPAPRVKIVDAEDGGMTRGVFSNLAQALSGAVDGDVIQIKHPDSMPEIAVQPVFIKPGISVTLQPFPGCQPILVLDKIFSKKDTYFFEVQSGRLAIEQMEIRLDPGNADVGIQSIVHLGESAQQSFKNCVLTLKSETVQLNVATLLDTDRMLKTDMPGASHARIEFTDCFVRGRGDLVNLRGCRLLHVEVLNSLIALDGSLLDVQAAGKSMPMDQGVHWKMERSSVFTAESLFTLRSPRGTGLTRTHARIEGCLLVALAPRQPVVLVDATREDKYLEWEGRQNFYAHFDDLRDWKDQYKDPDDKSIYENMTFPKLLDEKTVKTLWEATPQWFKPMEKTDLERLTGFGVPPDVEQRLLAAPPTVDE